MSRWVCPTDETNTPIDDDHCGHGGKDVKILSYHAKRPEDAECYTTHILRCWSHWRKISGYYIPSLTRNLNTVLGLKLSSDHVETLIGLEILNHDVGKLTEQYQRAEPCRHEIISTYIMFPIFLQLLKPIGIRRADLLASMLASVIYLHHEALWISHRQYELRTPTYSYLLNWLAGKQFHMLSRWKKVFNYFIKDLLNEEKLNTMSTYQIGCGEILRGSEIARELGRIIVLVDGQPNPMPIRLAIASLLHPLTICDNMAGNKRGGIPTRLGNALDEFLKIGALRIFEE